MTSVMEALALTASQTWGDTWKTTASQVPCVKILWRVGCVAFNPGTVIKLPKTQIQKIIDK